MSQGVVKSYDPNTGNGIIILDTDKSEVFLAPGSLKGSIFRTFISSLFVISFFYIFYSILVLSYKFIIKKK